MLFRSHTPVIEKYEVLRHGDVRRAKLYYLRDLRGKASKIKERRGADGEIIVTETPVVEAAPKVEAATETPVVSQETPAAVEETAPEATPEA